MMRTRTAHVKADARPKAVQTIVRRERVFGDAGKEVGADGCERMMDLNIESGSGEEGFVERWVLFGTDAKKVQGKGRLMFF